MTHEARRSLSDLVLVARDRRAPIRDQHAAFATLVERFEDMALATALRACDDLESARDVSQEAFIAAWRHLPTLREPAAFGAWLKRLVRTHATRARRRRDRSEQTSEMDVVSHVVRDPADLASRSEEARLIRQAIDRLPESERVAIALFYFLDAPLRVIGLAMGINAAQAGKNLYKARLRLRRGLSPSVADAFLAVKPTPAFTRRLRAGLYDELVGDYRFAQRPEHIVSIRREGDALVSYAGGQRNVLSSRCTNTLATTEFDGEGRFQRDRRGHISRFVYYEFGRRVAVAHKL